MPLADLAKAARVERRRRHAAVPALIVEFNVDAIGWRPADALAARRGQSPRRGDAARG